MQQNKFPFKYYVILFLIFLLAILFWMIIFQVNNISNDSESTSNTRNVENVFIDSPKTEIEYWQQDYLPEHPSQIIPIDTNKIINDTINQRRIVSNLVNIAIKNSANSIAKFANDFKLKYPSEDYKIVYIDSVINRLQIQLPEKTRKQFKKEVKVKLNPYKLLVWDETLFDYVKDFNDPKLKDNSTNWYLKAININNAWDVTNGDKKIVIAVIDNGFELNHPELKGKAVKQYNVIDRTNNVSPNKENHGTHVASTIVANGNNNQGLVGICPNCSFMPIKVEDRNGQISNTYIIDAILYAIKNKADVINLSLGMQIPMGLNIPITEQKEYINSGAKDEEEFWNDIFSFAKERNITCVLAAGNSNINTGVDPFQRIRSTIKVGASNESNQKANFSNFGNLTTIYAPGTKIFGAKPGNNYETLQGTSMATPIISGYIGLLKSINKNISNEEIIKNLNRNSTTINGIKILNIKQID